MRNADMALYRAKSDGGGVHRFFEREMDLQAQRRRDMELDLRRAFANGEFEPHYQPLVDIAADRISGFESLLRWRHPEKGMISPAEFVPVAEDIGLIVTLGEWVLREACTEAAKWLADIKVAVNLSPVQFPQPQPGSGGDLGAGAFRFVAAPAGTRNHRIIVPGGDRSQSGDPASVARTRRQHFDGRFRTGYSSLSYLRSFPFDKIKIDRSFVKDLVARTDCVAIVRAISGLGRSLNITTTAEGVETTDQLDWLRAEGCNEVQGFLFSAAKPASEIWRVLVRGSRRRRKSSRVPDKAGLTCA